MRCMCVCVYCLYLARRISASNLSASAITLNNQSAKDINQYFKTELSVKDSLPSRSVLILSNGLSKLGERAHYRNLISTVGGFESNLNKKYDEFSARPEKHSVV